MSMFPPKKFGNDKLYFDSNFSIIDLPASNYREEYEDVSSATLYSMSNGFIGEFSQPVSVNGLNGEAFLITDNANQNYNKCYYQITSRTNVTNGDIWKTKTHYKLTVTTPD